MPAGMRLRIDLCMHPCNAAEVIYLHMDSQQLNGATRATARAKAAAASVAAAAATGMLPPPLDAAFDTMTPGSLQGSRSVSQCTHIDEYAYIKATCLFSSCLLYMLYIGSF